MSSQSKVTALFNDCYQELVRYLSSKFNIPDEVDDIAQDAFHNILQKDAIANIDNPRAYLYQTARNIALNKIKRQGFQDGYLTSLIGKDDLVVPPEREMLASLDIEAVKNELMKLSEKDRHTFILNRIEGKTYKEISLELNVTVSTVEKRIMKVLSKLRRAIDQ